MALIRRSNESGARPAYPAGAPVAPPPPFNVPAEDANQALDNLKAKSELDRRVAALQDEFAERQWNLGGLAYEMAARNYFRLEVLRQQAAELQRIDAELGEARRLQSIDRAAAGGDCPKCGALFGKGAFFCWNCGFDLT